MNGMSEYREILGMKARDRVTGISGVVTSICFDLYGCVQCVINRGLDKDGKQHDNTWMDYARLEVVDSNRVMPLPTFGEHIVTKQVVTGPEDKPSAKY